MTLQTELAAGRRPALRGLPTHQRRPGWVALGLGLITATAALGGWLDVRAGDKTPIVVVAAPVPAGHPISRQDLTTISVAGPLTAVRGADLDSVVGQKAVVALLPGMPVQRSMLSTAGSLGAGQARVGIAVASGQFPSDGVDAGDTVEVLQLPDADSGAAGSGDPAQVLVRAALVWASGQDPSRPGGILLTVTLPEDVVPQVAAASGAGHVSVVKVAPR